MTATMLKHVQSTHVQLRWASLIVAVISDHRIDIYYFYISDPATKHRSARKPRASVTNFAGQMGSELSNVHQ